MDKKIREIEETLKCHTVNIDWEISNEMYCNDIEYLLQKIKKLEELKGEGHILAVLVLQSDAYKDPEIRDAIDNFLTVEAKAERR